MCGRYFIDAGDREWLRVLELLTPVSYTHLVNLTDEAVRRIAHSFALWLAGQKGVGAEMLRISVGHDSRLSAQRIKAAVLQDVYKRQVVYRVPFTGGKNARVTLDGERRQ